MGSITATIPGSITAHDDPHGVMARRFPGSITARGDPSDQVELGQQLAQADAVVVADDADRVLRILNRSDLSGAKDGVASNPGPTPGHHSERAQIIYGHKGFRSVTMAVFRFATPEEATAVLRSRTGDSLAVVDLQHGGSLLQLRAHGVELMPVCTRGDVASSSPALA